MAKKQNQNRQRSSQRQQAGQANQPDQVGQGPNPPSEPSQPEQPDQSELKGQDTAVPTGDVQATAQPAAQPPRGAARSPKGGAKSANTRTGGQRVNTYAQPRRAERRPEIIRQRKEERRKAYERRRRNWVYIRIGIGVLIALVLAGIAWGAFRQIEQFQLRDDVVTYPEVAEAVGNHVEGPVQYDVIPPVGGPHAQVWQNCGYYDEPINNWNGVHSMEHGAVWVTYDPTLPQDQIDTLESKADQTYVLVSPYPGLKAPVVASVWGRQIELDGANDDRLDTFIREYRRNPETAPEQNGVCTMGTSLTTSEIPQQQPGQLGTPAASPTAPAAATPPASPVAPVSSPPATPVASPVASRPEAVGQG